MADKKVTQTQQVLSHLRLYGSISPLEAMRRYGIMRLGARIWDLKTSGHIIDKAIEKDGTMHYARYTLTSEAKS